MRKKDKERDRLRSSHYKESKSLSKTITSLQEIASSTKVKLALQDSATLHQIDAAVKRAKTIQYIIHFTYLEKY